MTWTEDLIDCANKNGSSRATWQAIDKLKLGPFGHHKKTTNLKMKTPEGITAKTPKENAKIFAEYFGKKMFLADSVTMIKPSSTNYHKHLPTTISENHQPSKNSREQSAHSTTENPPEFRKSQQKPSKP